MSPLDPIRIPTSQEVCIAAASNQKLANDIASGLMTIFKYFEDDKDNFEWWEDLLDNPTKIAVFLCAAIVVQSIADNSPYLAGLSEVQECISKWNPAYLC
jgi:hypothetical protein